MTASNDFVLHNQPVWRDRSNFIINAKLADEDTKKFEQLFVHQLAETRFELCCIPFFLMKSPLAT